MTSVTWNPADQQQEDADTVWMLDVSAEQNVSITAGGLIDSYGTFRTQAECNPWRAGSGYNIEPGKFTDGIRGNAATSAWLYMPGEHLPTKSFTVELWVKRDTAWSNGGQREYLLTFGYQRPDVSGPSVSIYSNSQGKLEAAYRHFHGSTEVAQAIADTAVGPADEWVGVFLTYDGSTLTLRKHSGGSLSTVGTKSVTPSRGWSYTDETSGMSILPGKQGAGGGQMSAWVISDIRISRVCRIPSQNVTIPDANLITVSDTETGDQVSQNLLGIVHYLGIDTSFVGNESIEALTTGIIKVGRTDKFLSAVPMKSGSPDSTRPTLGHSGLYSYDFRPLEHTLAYYTRLGMSLYIGIDSTPSILGGSVPPFTSSECANPNRLVGHASFANEVPNDLEAMATISADMYWHVTRTLGHTPICWGIWNEPSGSSFWEGNTTQFNEMYEAIVSAIVAIDSDVYIGGPDEDIDSAYVSSLISYCGANDVPLRFVSTHHYGSDFGYYKRVQRKLETLSASAGITTPDMIVGEWNWNLGHLPGTGRRPFRDVNVWPTSFIATHNMSTLIELQSLNVEIATRYHGGNSTTVATGENAMGLTSGSARWAAANTYDIWSRLGDARVLTIASDDVENGVRVLAARIDDDVNVVACNFKWRKDRNTPLTVTLPDSVAEGTVSSYHVVDSTHSNYFDNPVGTGALETTTPPTITNGAVTITMEPRSVHLLTITPPVAATRPVAASSSYHAFGSATTQRATAFGW